MLLFHTLTFLLCLGRKNNMKETNNKARKIRKNYFCIVEGQQEKLYLDHLARLINHPPQKVITFNTKIGKAHDLKKSYVEYDSACLFDYDFNKIEFERNLSICIELDKKNKQKNKSDKRNVYHAYSNACFDLWLILHKKQFNRPVSLAKGYVKEVIQTFNLPYNADIKSEAILKQILQQISLEDVKKAIVRAESIRSNKLPCDEIHVNDEIYYPNPDFSIHKFIEVVLKQIDTL